jgi:hypothetical protein
MPMTTLRHELDSVTAQTLGDLCDEHDVRAYREALARAWPLADCTGLLGEERAEKIMVAVLEGRAGRDDDGRDWVQVADQRRTA